MKVINCGGKGGEPGPCPEGEHGIKKEKTALGWKLTHPAGHEAWIGKNPGGKVSGKGWGHSVRVYKIVDGKRSFHSEESFATKTQAMEHAIKSLTHNQFDEAEAVRVINTLNGVDPLTAFSEAIENCGGKGGKKGPCKGSGNGVNIVRDKTPAGSNKPSIKEFASELRKMGFSKEYDSRAGGIRTVQYSKQHDAQRKIDVQLWGDGNHRATHWIDGSQATTPTDFNDKAGMMSAIKHETTRRDHYKLRSGPKTNQFCNTGKGGGINPHCGKHGGGPVGRSGGTVGGGGSRQMRSTLGGSSVGGILGHKTKASSEDPGNQRLKSVFLGRSRGKSAKSDIGRGRSSDFRSYDAKGKTEGGKAQRTGSASLGKGRGAARSGGKVSAGGRSKSKGTEEEFYITKSGKLKSRRKVK